MTIEERLDALEKRCRAAEDHLAIQNLIFSYGPLVDSGSAQEAAALWIEGGGYNYSGGSANGTRKQAPEDLVAMYEGEGHMGLVTTGVSHLNAPAVIRVDGDAATAMCYSFVILREGERWFVWRAAINEFQCVRTAAGWRIAERLNRTLTGTEESHALMRKVIAL